MVLRAKIITQEDLTQSIMDKIVTMLKDNNLKAALEPYSIMITLELPADVPDDEFIRSHNILTDTKRIAGVVKVDVSTHPYKRILIPN